MYIINTDPTLSDYFFNKSGNFHTQIIGSRFYGVAPKAIFTIIKTTIDIASFLNVLVQVITSHLKKQQLGFLNISRKVVRLRGRAYTILPGSDMDLITVPHIYMFMDWTSQVGGTIIVLSAIPKTILEYPYLLSLPNRHEIALDIVTIRHVLAS